MVESDQETGWIEQSRQGDHAAFENLIRCHQRMVHTVTYRMTGSMSDAEDLAQETFIQAFQQLDMFRRQAAFASWLYRIAVNKCLNWSKREQRRHEVHRDWAKGNEDAAPADDSMSTRVQEALMKLHPKQRAAVVLTVYEELGHAEAARILSCSETTVSWRVFSAKRKLRGWLSGKELDE